MWPSPAAVARALVASRLPGSLHVACRPGPQPVCYACDAHGRLLLLSREGSPAGRALRPRPGDHRTVAAVLEIADLPCPGAGATLGRVWLSGWVRALEDVAARAAALDFAAAHPTGMLLDVGRGAVLHHVDLAAVRLERAGATIEVTPVDFVEATPAAPAQLQRLREAIAQGPQAAGRSSAPVR
ncbi:hypothetical protein GCM10010124_14440 [Pilimelia terevasa]|uniref:Uncharacterized protein n=1 Tax=Pilimelia terevasa TaxID=53372 RepID=A0A8J3BJ32_9ACTN|nr:hypothetical protein [Pilimelia terevasa]GGK23007.1 hypothetical protein GCM10010124_14440 [Pilimelia terevasa]